jgi:hypothetical protein
MMTQAWSGGLAADDDLFFESAPEVEWLREGASFWLFEENGELAIPRVGVEALPHVWEERRYQTNFSLLDGRVLVDSGAAPMHPTVDADGRPSQLGAGPLRMRCLEPFRKWHVAYEGTPIDTNVSAQIAETVDGGRRTPLRYELELEMASPVFVQDTSPARFFQLGKGEQKDGLSVGLGWRLEQMLRGEGELELGGERRTLRVVGSRVKRKSIRTDGLFLRGHCWQTAVFPDGRAFGYLSYPTHDDGNAGWNFGFIYQDGRMIEAKAVGMPWLRRITPGADDASVELHSERGVTRIAGKTALSTYHMGSVWGLHLQQCAVEYQWDDQTAYGMLERSAPPSLTTVDS